MAARTLQLRGLRQGLISNDRRATVHIDISLLGLAVSGVLSESLQSCTLLSPCSVGRLDIQDTMRVSHPKSTEFLTLLHIFILVQALDIHKPVKTQNHFAVYHTHLESIAVFYWK